ncbi:class I SAM-dependent methyltransferase [Vannielia litorea]|uniref:class I SAM-dependent methyltransferase n=1 Tax=Vannielia litorea TaxID=1217970 RepID=UPI001BCB1711|nr:class I SAM-dependent methyltransferase [Vannielia litorea]
MTDPATKTEAFWNRMAKGYAKRPIADEKAYAITLERTAAYLGPDARVLEAGAGTGTTARRLAPHAREILATDISGALLEIAQERIEADGLTNIALARHSLDDLPEGPFDAVICFNVLHLAPDPAAAVAALAARVRPGGHLITKTPCIAGRWPLRLLIGAMRLIGMAPMVQYFSETQVEEMHERPGLSIVETGSYPARSRFVVARKG